AEVANGRSSFALFIPIVISSLLFTPASSFIFAVANSFLNVWLAYTANVTLNIPTVASFYMVALISWLSARSLEQALNDLRAINMNLDLMVTQRTRALAESLSRERIEAGRNQAILNSIADGVIVFDKKWNATMANPAIRGMLELPAESIIDHNFRDLVNHPKLSENGRNLFLAMVEHDTQPLSFRVEWGDKTLSVSAGQIYDTREEGSVNVGTVTVFRDFTREAEVERLKSTFVGIVSHELRTPLGAILGYAEMFKEAVYGPMNEKQVSMAVRIMDNTKRLLNLINDLLDQAQMEAGKLTINMGLVRPSELIENIHELLDKTASDKNLSLTSEIDIRLPKTLIGDGTRLQQILINLVMNAIKFTDEGGVRVRLFPISNFKKWGIEVIDTGRGIPQAELSHIFESFRQVDSTVTRTEGGFGLGLAIVKQLVDLMNGNIEVTSIMQRGSTFTITLPLAIP
ncbi:MAG TPA: ATP-binding protein, partial [Anaerolineales bacterium]|nr:ATP-binding protein [Anaerolineales bacterium]